MWIRVLVAALAAAAAFQDSAAITFSDDFEHGLDRWRIIGEKSISIKHSGDPAHGNVLALVPNGDSAAIIRGSERWRRVRLEGDMLFPTGGDNYLGYLYNFTERGKRQDFGLIYLKGNDNYLQVNPHRDFNVSRLVYPEFRANLAGSAAVSVNRWQRFALEVDGASAHVYVGPGATPQMTFKDFEFQRGALGLQPRSVGSAVWVDNVTVRAIERLTYAGPPIPAVAYDRAALLTDWQVAGPFPQTDDAIGRHPERTRWSAFAADSRGAVISGRVTDFHGPNTVAYFRTAIEAASAGDAQVQFSTADDLSIWLNGEFQAFLARQDGAWFDFATNKAHAPRVLPVTLKAGRNQLVVRVRGGVYASGGFYGRLAR